ncbi:MAG: DUF1254 domain-containing protein [Chlorobi bacterium]|nr:DUF1254 domain-containing protein [Chlorobiota bacterium]
MNVPADILTPDKVETSIGELKYDDGRPVEETVKKAYHYIDVSRSVEAFLNNSPAIATEVLKIAFEGMGATEAHHVLISEQLVDAHQVWPTGNTGTVYVFGFFDLKKTGPLVIEMPGKAGPGFVDDGWMRWVTDMGPTGPDRGQGGTYVFLPPDCKMEIDAPLGGKKTKMKIAGSMRDVFVVKSPTYHNWMALRGFLVDGKPDFSVNLFKQKLKIYPLDEAANPPEMKFVNMSGKNTQAVFPASFRYFKMLNDVVQREPLSALDNESRGVLSAIGIEKGNEFNPDEYWKSVYEDAAKIGDAAGRSILFSPRDPEAYFYPDRQWYTGFVGNNYLWLKDDGRGGINLDARILFFWGAIAVTPAMAIKMVGLGSQYAFCSKDKDGKYFDGSKNYKLTIPPNVPAKDFWSIVMYDPQTRGMLLTDQKYPAINNKRSNLTVNPDGSVDIYFGPKAPEGKENNWIQTVPGKGWFVLFRLYGPLEPWFDKSWKLNDFERID